MDDVKEVFGTIELIDALIENEIGFYNDSETDEERQKHLKNVNELIDRRAKIQELNNAESKTKIEADLKKKMNELDNKTKLEVASMEKEQKLFSNILTAVNIGTEMAIHGSKLYFATASMGDQRRFDASGYATINSPSSRFANSIATSVYKM